MRSDNRQGSNQPRLARRPRGGLRGPTSPVLPATYASRTVPRSACVVFFRALVCTSSHASQRQCSALRRFPIEHLQHGLKIFPYGLLELLAPQQECGVVGRHHGDSAPLAPDAAPSTCRRDDLQVLRGAASEGDDRLGLHELELRDEEVCAGLRLRRKRRSILWWAALDDVADVDAVALVAHCGDHSVQQLSRASDEGRAFLILVVPWPLADEYQIRVRRAAREHALGSPAVKLAPGAFGGSIGQHLQAGADIMHGVLGMRRWRNGDPCRRGESRAAERFLPFEQFLGARDHGCEVVFGVRGHFGASIGRFR